MNERSVNRRLVVIGLAILVGVVLLYPPEQKLRAGLDIAGGTSLIFEIDTTDAGSDPTLAERVKALLQKRVDPKGVYNLVWRVQGRNRLEVQMPLPPKDATARRQAYADALKDLFDQEIRRGDIMSALDTTGEVRQAALERLARGHADEMLSKVTGSDEKAAGERAAIEQVVARRQQLLLQASQAYDAMLAARAAAERGPVSSQPVETAAVTTTEPATAPASAPAQTQQELDDRVRDATEAYEDAMDAVLATNINRRRFQEVVELDDKSPVRKQSIKSIREAHPDLTDKLSNVLDKHKEFRQGRQFLDGPADLKRLLHGAGKLEWRILPMPSTENVTKFERYRNQLKEGRLRVPGEDEGWFKIDNPLQFFNMESPAQLTTYDYKNEGRWVVDKLGDEYYVLGKLGAQHGLLADKTKQRWELRRARIDRDERGRWCVRFTLDASGGSIFENLTRNNIDQPLCILVDDVAYSAPNIQSVIRSEGVITGDFSLEKVNYLVQTMEGGTLPARLKDTPLSERTVGSSLGEANRDMAVRAGLIGAVAVIAVMIGYYWVCGLIANVAMLMNVLLTLSALAMLNARITLDGIAGIILAVGMSVDANVLIYERMREEKARGASLRMMIKNGYDKAFTTIFDSNVTTLLTCVIIYYAGSEEVKGFGLTLGWGIALNMFTAVFVTKTLFALLLKYNLIKDVKMAHVIHVPNIDWVRKGRFLIPISFVLVLGGVSLLFVRGARTIFDIEFLGGVAAELELKQAGLDDREISDRLQGVAGQMRDQARGLDQVQVTAVPDQADAYAVSVAGVPGDRLLAMLTEPLESAGVLQRSGIAAVPGTEQLRLFVQPEVTADALVDKIRSLAPEIAAAADNLNRASVNAVLETAGEAGKGLVWNVTTTSTNMRLVQNALEEALGEDMRIQPKITYTLRGDPERPYPVTDRALSRVVPDLPAGLNVDLADYLGGAVIDLDQIEPPLSAEGLQTRLQNMLFQPDFLNMPQRDFLIIGVTPVADRMDDQGRQTYSRLLVASVDPDLRYADGADRWLTGFAQGELSLVRTALTTEQTLRKVMQFKPQIATRASQQAIVAVVLSWAMIIGYVWIRFGRLAYGLGGVVALIHDVLMALAFVGFSGWLGGTGHPVGEAMLIEDFKINMTIIAALLTIIGFSINDTIVIFDRIRELRGRLGVVTPKIVNDSINECMSRTILTTFTVLLVIFIAYVWGGSSIRGFNYCMLIGCLSGTYSTIVIAAPLLLVKFIGGTPDQER